MNDKEALLRIKDRYFRPVIASSDGSLCHHADCSIYRSIEVYGTAACTCGFLHDLQIIKETIRDKLHPRYYEESCLKNGLPKESTPEEQKEFEKLFDSFGFKMVKMEAQEWKFICKRDWKLIEEVFGEDFRKRKEIDWYAKKEEVH